MIEAAIIAVRWVQYLGAAVVFGLPLFFVCVARGRAQTDVAARARLVVAATAALLAVSSLLSIGLQASLFSGSFAAGFDGEAIESVVSFMELGKAAVVRAVAAGLVFVLVMAVRPARVAWGAAAILGGVAAATLGWMGHGASTEGAGHATHLIADILHSLAACIWIGALAGFLLLLFSPAADREFTRELHGALARFSSIGALLVVTLAVTGLINSWFVVGPENLSRLRNAPYGQLLIAKLALLAVMLGLAAVNRFRLTPRLAAARLGEAAESEPAMAALRRSVALEAALGFGILALVAWFGTLAPPAAG
jgi:putative copper resistance protein D